MSTANFNTAVQTSKVLCKLVYKKQTNSVRLLATINPIVNGKDLCQRLAEYVGTDVSLRDSGYEVFPALVKQVKRACDEFGSQAVVVAISDSTWNKLANTLGEYDQDAWELLVWPYGGTTLFIGADDFKTRFITE